MQGVTQTEYLCLLNIRLRKHERYVAGMEFLAYPNPRKPEKASGYNWVDGDGWHGVYVAVANKVKAKYFVDYALSGGDEVRNGG